jgi:hypothetical protein
MLRGESLDWLLGAPTPLLGLALDQVGSDSFGPKAFVLRHLQEDLVSLFSNPRVVIA